MDNEDKNNEFKVKLIVAMCKGGGIGINNKLPWKISDDLRYFSTLTSGEYGKYMRDNKKNISEGKYTTKICNDELNIKKNVLIMGKNTWLSLPNHPKPLPYRDSIILSSTIPESKNVICSDYESKYISDLNIHLSSISRAMYFCSFGNINDYDDMSVDTDFYRNDKCVKYNEEEIMKNSKNIKYKIYNDIWIIGGSQVYESIMNISTNSASNKNILIDEFYITYIDKEYNCDTYFPLIENINLYCVASIEKKICKCEDEYGISDVKVYYILLKRMYTSKTKMDDSILNINPSIATDENIELIKRLKIGIRMTS